VLIAVDAMGGDHAPEEICKGAIKACSEYEDLELALVGIPEAILPHVDNSGIPSKALSSLIVLILTPKSLATSSSVSMGSAFNSAFILSCLASLLIRLCFFPITSFPVC